MGRPTGWSTAQTGRAPMRSPGALPHRREIQRAFWRLIALGVTTEASAIKPGAVQSVELNTKTFMRLLMLALVASVVMLAAANIGSAQNTTPGGGNLDLPPCAVGQQPTPTAPCIYGPGQGGNQGGDQNIPDPNQGGGQQGGGQQGGGGGGGFNYATMADCAAGQVPTPTAPCRFAMQPCAAGQQPSPQAPCRPQGAGGQGNEEEEGGFDAPPSGDIQKEMKSKYMVINLNVEGAGDTPNTLNVTFTKVVSGVGKATVSYLNDQLAGDSFEIATTAKTKCFADTKDADKIPDLVSCKELDDAADNAPGSIRAQFRGKVSFNSSTYEPVFKAQKIVFLKGSFNIAKVE